MITGRKYEYEAIEDIDEPEYVSVQCKTICPVFNNIKIGSIFCRDCKCFIAENISKKIVYCKGVANVNKI